MYAEGAAVVHLITYDGKVGASVREDATHTMFVVVIDNGAVADVDEEETSTVGLFGGQPDVKEDGIRWDFSGGARGGMGDGEVKAISRDNGVSEVREFDAFEGDTRAAMEADTAPRAIEADQVDASTVHGDIIGSNIDTAGTEILTGFEHRVGGDAQATVRFHALYGTKLFSFQRIAHGREYCDLTRTIASVYYIETAYPLSTGCKTVQTLHS